MPLSNCFNCDLTWSDPRASNKNAWFQFPGLNALLILLICLIFLQEDDIASDGGDGNCHLEVWCLDLNHQPCDFYPKNFQLGGDKVSSNPFCVAQSFAYRFVEWFLFLLAYLTKVPSWWWWWVATNQPDELMISLELDDLHWLVLSEKAIKHLVPIVVVGKDFTIYFISMLTALMHKFWCFGKIKKMNYDIFPECIDAKKWICAFVILFFKTIQYLFLLQNWTRLRMVMWFYLT